MSSARVRLALCASTFTVGLLMSACSSAAPSQTACGWDLSTKEGQAASAERMDEAARWMTAHPGQPVPEPTSEYWHGQCPTTATPSPPVEENEGGQ